MSARDDDIADYVLGLMEPLAAEAFERAMADDRALRLDVEANQHRLHELDVTAPSATPDPALWSRIERRLALARSRETKPARRTSLLESLGFWRTASMAGAAASLLLLLGVGMLLLRPVPEPQYVAVLVSEDGTMGAIVEVDEAGVARLVPLQNIPVPDGRALEVWTLPSIDSGPVSVGLLADAHGIELAVGSLPPARPDQLFEITLEPATGSPIGRPTGPVLFKGLTVRAL